MAVAIELFTTKGYAATSVREIVEGARVTKPVLYYYFGSKEGLYLEIYRSVERQFNEVIARAAAAAPRSSRDQIERLCLEAFGLFTNNKPAVRLLNAIFWGPAQSAPPVDLNTFHQRIERELGGMALRGIESGEFRKVDPEDITLGVLAVLSFAMDLQLAQPERVLTRTRLLNLLEMLFSGIHAR
jgi:AcrR family transcriptional regulator